MESQDVDVKTEVSSPAANGHNISGGGGMNRGGPAGRKRGYRGGGVGGGRGPVGNDHRGGMGGGGGGGGGNAPQGDVKQEDYDRRQQRFNGPNRNQEAREYDRISERLMMLGGPTTDLPPLDTTEKKFSGRSRLYIGNLTNDVTEEEIKEMFAPYGETNELFINKEKMFAFIRVDYQANAEKAKRELDGKVRKNRPLKVRFAPNGAAVKVRNLTPWVTNELLYTAFSVFGEIERCVIIVDDRGKSTCEGLVEYARKPSALSAIRHCSDGCFFLTSSLRPVIVETYEMLDENDGFQEKAIGPKKSNDYYKARDIGPRFANKGSFEFEYGTRWKQLAEIFKQKLDALKREQQMEEEKLEAQMEYARYEHETEMLREQLRARELDRERQKREWEMKEQAVEEARRHSEDQLRRMQEEMALRMHHQEEDLRRRQEENSLFLKAHQLNDMLDQQERYDTTDVAGGAGDANQGGLPQDPKNFIDSYDQRNNRNNYDMDNRDMRGGSGGGHWGSGSRGGGRDDYQNKRRRY